MVDGRCLEASWNREFAWGGVNFAWGLQWARLSLIDSLHHFSDFLIFRIFGLKTGIDWGLGFSWVLVEFTFGLLVVCLAIAWGRMIHDVRLGCWSVFAWGR